MQTPAIIKLFLYYTDENLSYGLRLASHSGEDTKGLDSGYAYKITINETSPFVKYSHSFSEAGDTVIEGFAIGGLNLATMKVSHNILEEISASTTALMLEGGIFAGMKKDDMTFGGSINLPLDSYEADFLTSLAKSNKRLADGFPVIQPDTRLPRMESHITR